MSAELSDRACKQRPPILGTGARPPRLILARRQPPAHFKGRVAVLLHYATLAPASHERRHHACLASQNSYLEFVTTVSKRRRFKTWTGAGPIFGPAPVRVNKKPAGPKPRTGPVRSLFLIITTRLHSNLKSTTLKCVHLVECGPFPSHDKDDIWSAISENPMIHTGLMVLELSAIKVHEFRLLTFFARVTLTLTWWPLYINLTCMCKYGLHISRLSKVILWQIYIFVQCFDTVGWVIWSVKTRPRYDL